VKSSSIKYLSVARVLYIHDRAIKKYGGKAGIRDKGLVESAVGRPQATFDGKDLYKSIFDKAAALLQSLLKNHAFVDGNKRTALASAGLFLKINGWNLVNNHMEEVEFTIKVDNQNLSLEEISKWLKDHSREGKLLKSLKDLR